MRLVRSIRVRSVARILCGPHTLTSPTRSPVTPAYYGAQALAMDPGYHGAYPITRQQYQEYGSAACRRRFQAAQGLGGIVRQGEEGSNTQTPLKRRSGQRNGGKMGKKKKWGSPDTDEDSEDDSRYIITK